jgi:hypothetical protein
MINTKFIGIGFREYIVIQKHPKFEGVWRCYPTKYDMPKRPYKQKTQYFQELIKLYGEDYIKENLIEDKINLVVS